MLAKEVEFESSKEGMNLYTKPKPSLTFLSLMPIVILFVCLVNGFSLNNEYIFAIVVTSVLYYSVIYTILFFYGVIKKITGGFRKCSCSSVTFFPEVVDKCYIDTTPRTTKGKKDARYKETGYSEYYIKFNCKCCGNYHLDKVTEK